MAANYPFDFIKLQGGDARLLLYKNLKDVVTGPGGGGLVYTRVEVISQVVQVISQTVVEGEKDHEVLVGDETGIILFKLAEDQISYCGKGNVLLLSMLHTVEAASDKVKLIAGEMKLLWAAGNAIANAVGAPVIGDLGLFPFGVEVDLNLVVFSVRRGHQRRFTVKEKAGGHYLNVQYVLVRDANNVEFFFKAVGKDQIDACKKGAILGLERALLKKEERKCTVRLPPNGCFHVLFRAVPSSGEVDFSGYIPAKYARAL